MKSTLLYIALSLMPSLALAQEDTKDLSSDVTPKAMEAKPMESNPAMDIKPQLCDSASLHLPALTDCGQLPSLSFPYLGFGYYTWPMWNLHKGLNVSLGASVFTTFGSGNTWSGAGFSEQASLMYAMPLSKRLSLAIGGYIKNTSWAHDSYRNAGISALLDYQVNDRLDVFMYGQKHLVGDKQMPPVLYDITDMADRIGVGANYKVTPSFSIGLSVDYCHYNANTPLFMRNGPQEINKNNQNREFPR